MLNNFLLKRNDNSYELNYSLVNSDNTIPNLTGATVVFNVGDNQKLLLSKTAIIDDAVSGKVSYTFTNEDTLYDGLYRAEFVVTFANGAVLSYPRTGSISINIQKNVDTSLSNVLVDAIAEKQGDFTAKLNSILQQAGNITMSTMNEWTWTATAGQLTYVMPAGANYDPIGKWFEVYVGGTAVSPDLIDRSVANQFTILVSSSLIVAGLTVIARWTEPIVPVTVGHHTTHQIGGSDVIDVTKLLNYQEQIATPISNNTAQLAQSAYYVDNEPIIAGESDWTGRLNRAIANASSTGKNVLLTKPVYDVSGTIWLKSNVTLISFWGSKIQGHGVTEILKTDGSTTYANIKIIGIEVDGGKSYQDDNLLICSQFYNVTGLIIINSKFTHSSTGIGLDTCTNVFISDNTFFGMYQQTNSASQYPGSYGYGVTVVECENVFIKHNILGVNDNTNKGWIDRHAVYVSTKGTKDSYRIFVRHNSVVMKDYNSDADAVTGFEYALKCIGGNEVYFEHNHVLHGIGGMFLEYENSMQSGNIYIKHNEFIDIWKCANKVMPFDTNSYNGTLKRVEIIDNYFQLKGTYATGYDGKNIYEVIIKDNTFISTYSDPAYKNACYYINLQSNHNTVQATNYFIKNNIVQGFKNVGYINNVTNFYCEDTLKDYPSPFEPFQYIENVTNKTTKLKYIGTPYLHKKDTYAGLTGLTYFDTDLGMDITCLSVSPVNWVNAKGEQVVGVSSARPNQASIKGGHKFWEQDNNRIVYWTRFAWSTNNVIVQSFDTLANIKSINTAYLNYSSEGIYATDTKKMLYWDAYANAWKDAMGNAV